MRTVHFFATYYDQFDKCQTLINSLKAQTRDNWKLTICSNGDKSAKDIKIDDDRIKVIVTKENSGFWGAKNRRDFIKNTLKDDEMLVNTSVEDYYVPQTVQWITYKEIGKNDKGEIMLAERNEDFIYWDFSHHHFGYGTMFAISQPRIKKMDWGNFAILGRYAKGVDMDKMKRPNPQNPQEFIEYSGWEEFMGDGIFVEMVFHKFPNISNIRIPKILFVKN